MRRCLTARNARSRRSRDCAGALSAAPPPISLRPVMKLFMLQARHRGSPKLYSWSGLALTAIQIDEHTKVIEGGVDFRAHSAMCQHQLLVRDDGTLPTEGPPSCSGSQIQVPARTESGSRARSTGRRSLPYKGISDGSKVVFRRQLEARHLMWIGARTACAHRPQSSQSSRGCDGEARAPLPRSCA